MSTIILLSLAGLAVFVSYHVFAGRPSKEARVYFLDVGQGDAELAIFPGNVKVMTDAGPDKKVVSSLEKILSDRYIDLAIISHPQLDHFNGFNFLLDHYRFGAFIFNGRNDTKTVREWPALLDKIKSRNIPLITLAAGDSVHFGDNEVDFLSPGPDFIQSGELNDTGFVELIKTGLWRALLTADIGFNVEDYLVKNALQPSSGQAVDIKADILKVPHHGSKYSSGAEFLNAVGPRVAVIEVGENNKYGHPTKEALERLASTTAKIFRTDQNGNIEVFAEDGKLKVFTEK